MPDKKKKKQSGKKAKVKIVYRNPKKKKVVRRRRISGLTIKTKAGKMGIVKGLAAALAGAVAAKKVPGIIANKKLIQAGVTGGLGFVLKTDFGIGAALSPLADVILEKFGGKIGLGAYGEDNWETLIDERASMERYVPDGPGVGLYVPSEYSERQIRQIDNTPEMENFQS